ncbi:hypothetical protein, partial [Acetobacter okinawensis]|uniref:hypothetical protein n=1 Tax=Acetobacter okinawensis TaxID=1076594 RepID=UPI001A7E5A7A
HLPPEGHLKETAASNFSQAQIRPTQQATFSTELPHLGRLDDFCSFPKADVVTLTSIGRVWDISAVHRRRGERRILSNADFQRLRL